MSEALWVSKSGGYRVATDEVFALQQTAGALATELLERVSSLNRLISQYFDSDLEAASRGARHAKDGVSELALALSLYVEQVARQESFRRTLFNRPLDASMFALVSWAMGDSQAAGEFGGWRQALADRPRLGWGPQRGVVAESVIDDAAATVLLAAGPYRSEVAVERALPDRQVGIAMGVAERISRIPESAIPVTIERYTLPDGQTHTEVFVSGTAEWTVEEGTSPFDMRSNLALVAGLPAASVLATEAAMRKAGVSQGDRVLFVGHSQGGAVAATLARSGRYDTAGLITIGAPSATIAPSGDYPALIIEHRDDVVPKLAGQRVDHSALVVTTDSGALPGDLGDAHSMERYGETAERIDSSPDRDLSHFASGFPTGLVGTRSRFSAEQRD